MLLSMLWLFKEWIKPSMIYPVDSVIHLLNNWDQPKAGCVFFPSPKTVVHLSVSFQRIQEA